MKNKGLIALHSKNSITDLSPEGRHHHDNTAYGKIDLKGWSGLTRINSIEDNFGGGEDPSNKAIRMSIMKSQSRPTSANLHNLRSISKAQLISQTAVYENRASKFDRPSKYTRSHQSHANKTISTAAATHPMYNAAMMSKQSKGTGRT